MRVSVLVGLVFLIMTGTTAAQRTPARPGGGNQPPASKIPRGDGRVNWPRVTPVAPQRAAEVQRTAQQIDRLLEAGYRQHDVRPNPRLSDELFCRRAYLDIAGRVPKLEELGEFLQSRDANRRSQLIDRLLSSHDHVSHMYNYWADILRLKDHPINNNQIAQPYHEWIKESLCRNTPYDKWVKEMLTAEGRLWENPAVGFVMRDSGMPLAATDNMVQIFLGTQIGCAQCHDHPFDKWTQRDFYQMAAYTYGTLTRVGGGDKKRFPNGNPAVRLRKELQEADPEARPQGSFNRVINANMFAVYENPGRRLKLPHDYQYDNGKPNQVISPDPIFGSDLPVAPGQSPRQVIADWIVSPQNPRFARNIVNRMWKRAFGIGLIEPVNDIRDDSLCSNPEVLDLLARKLVEYKFDVREIQRVIYHTDAWQREASPYDVDPTEIYAFPGPTLRRMTAEQLWDSLLTLAVYNVESFTRPSMKDLASVINLDLNTVSAAEVEKAAKQFDEQFNRGAQNKITRQRNTYKGRLTLARASELPVPVPADHFLRQFGQGDRELLEAGNTDGSVSQILTMFNGQVTHMMLERGSVIYDNISRPRSAPDRVKVIFYSILSRAPRDNEEDTALEEIRLTGNAGYGNVIWALVNTKEFLFIQ